MKIKDIMTTPALSVSEDTDIMHIAVLMKDNDIGVIPVCSKDGNILGVVTDRDIVIRGVCEPKNPTDITAKDIMTRDIITVSPLTDLDDAFDIMADVKVRRLPVVENSSLIGMVTLGDLSQSLDYTFEVSDVLCEVCKSEIE